MLEVCERDGIGFIPWFPLEAGKLAEPGGTVDGVAGAPRRDAEPGRARMAAAALAVMLPIPGTGSVEHLEENLAATSLRLAASSVAELDYALG